MLVLDEPTAGLDPKQIIETRELIRSLGGSHTIILSTHILPEVANTCHRVIIINKGKVVAVDTPENLTHQLKGAATFYVQVAGNQDATALLSGLPGVSRVTAADRHETFTGYEVEAEANRDIRTDVARAVVQQGLGLLELRPTRITLEEIFLQLTTEIGKTWRRNRRRRRRRWRMASTWRNISAIAGKELRELLLLARRLGPARTLRHLFGTFFAAGLLGFLRPPCSSSAVRSVP